jgi:hypothetical protein
MTPEDEIIEMAKSINEDWWLDDIDLQDFAKLVAEKEREECAKICDDHWEKDGAAYYCALTIRYRGQA